jgi:hypothetical protein
MTNGPRLRALVAAGCVIALAALLVAFDGSGQAGAAGGPDVTVFSFTDISNYGSANGFAAYSLGTTSCNRGDQPLNWCSKAAGCAPGAGEADHPAIVQNLYRLKNSRFEQIGMSWVKHGFASANGSASGCSGAGGQSCQPPPAGSAQLGVGCIDPYTASTNGFRPLGPRSEVNPTTGTFPYPPNSPDGPYAIYDQRIKVATGDVDPALNAGATYYVEGQYVAADDASAGNASNNASYQRVTVGAAPGYALTQVAGTFVEAQPALAAWPAQDPAVLLVNVDVPGPTPERYHVARKATALGGGLWHYEYTIHNLSSDRAVRAFTVQFPQGTGLANMGFKSIPHHSGEPYATDPWAVSTTASAITWSTATFASDPNANALRWGTTFNFWFDADQPPASSMVHTLGLFTPGNPSTVDFPIASPLLIDGFESGDLSRWSASSP